jgi:hypothetical protein
MNDRTFVRWAALALALLLAASPAVATTYNSPNVVDGIPPSTGETNADPSWASDELLAEDPVGDSAWGPFNDLHGLWVTWDTDGIYFSVQGAVWDAASGIGANSVNLYIDADYGRGTGIGDLSQIDANALDAVTRNLWRPLTIGAGFGADWGYTCWAGRFDLGFLDLSDPQAPVNLFQGVNGQSNPINTSAEGVIEGRNQANNRGYELFVPWNVFYPDQPAGRVPAGTQIALVVAQVGGGDSLSPESIPDGADDRLIERPVVFTVDANGDGIPDVDWPPSGSIAGTIALDDPSDLTSVIEVIAVANGIEAARTRTPAGGGAYVLDRLGPATYTISLDSPVYIAEPVTISLAENEDRTGVDFVAEKVTSGVDVSFVFVDGPQATTRTLDVVYSLTRDADGRVFRSERLGPSASLSVSIPTIPPGAYTIAARASSNDLRIGDFTGYRAVSIAVNVVDDEIAAVGPIELELVQPTRLEFRRYTSGGYGPSTRTLRFPASIPDRDFFVRGNIEIVAVDDQGNEALLDAVLRQQIEFNLTSIDPRFPARGQVEYWTLDDDATPAAQAGTRPSLLQLVPMNERLTRAAFRLSSDFRETLRLRVRHASITGSDLEIQVVPRLPTEIVLTLDDATLMAGEATAVRGQLLDATGNPSSADDLVVTFAIAGAMTGGASVLPAAAIADPNGRVGADGEVLFSSTRAGTFLVTASADNGLEVITSNPVEVRVEPAAPAAIELTPAATALGEVTVGVRLRDDFGNTVPGAARSVPFGAGPPELVTASPSTVSIDAEGRGTAIVAVRPALSGVVDVVATDATLEQSRNEARLRLLPGLVGFDEPAPESDPAHNTLPGFDLTTLAAWIADGELVVRLPFTSSEDGLHFGLLIETSNTPDGAFSDAFVFPISYGHDLLPDYVFTYKYSANDYGDLRRPAGAPGSWQWFNWSTGEWPGAFEDGVNAVAAQQVTRDAEGVSFRVPIDVVAPGFRPGVDSLRLQAYLMRETDVKTPALDSIPQDATVDMIPETGNWFDPGNLLPTTLSEYVVTSPSVLGSDLRIDEISFTPTMVTQGESSVLRARPVFVQNAPAAPVYQLFADLSTLGGDNAATMRDDGIFPDDDAGDGLYAVEVRVPLAQFAGSYDVVVQALELTSSQEAFGTAALTVTGEPELQPILTIVDAEGDDHGPNRRGEQFLYYEYPTSSVFFDGVFDLRRLDVFDLGDRLLFRVTITDLTSPSEPDAADWNAIYPSNQTCPEGQRTDLNLQNMVILLDTKEGNNVGSTAIAENRWADVAPQDAWEYALVFDGWWKGLVKSNGRNERGAWTTLTSDVDFYFCASDQTNTIDGYLLKSQLEPSELEAIENWDVIVLMSGHDGDSNRENWGGVRWVNESISEWQFGGGRNGEPFGERDPNIMDVMVHAGLALTGEPKPDGRPQEDQMNYLGEEALRRFADQQRAVQLEATRFIDERPPTVRLRNAVDDRLVVPGQILLEGPVVLGADIFDDGGVASATLYWRTAGEDVSQRRAVPMGRVRSDIEMDGTLWVADLRWEDVAAATDEGEIPDPDDLAAHVRYILIDIDAVDLVGNSTATGDVRDPIPVELPVEPVARIRYPDLLAREADGRVVVDLNEGSQWSIDASTLSALAGGDPDTEFELVLDAVPQAELALDRRIGSNETVLGSDNRFLGIGRRITLWQISGSDTTEVNRLPEPAQLSLHFPRYLLGNERASDLQFFRYEPRTDRWVLLGGHGERSGSSVTTLTRDLGLFGVFTTSFDIDTDKAITGLQLTPNPFSPNDDGLYDELSITYVLPGETESAIVEIFDIRGERLRTLNYFQPDGVTNRTLGLEWDGRDEAGRTVPMGLYIVRVEVREKQTGRVERATRAVAVVR